MARRRRKQDESLLATLLVAPWQVSMVIGVAAFIFLKWLLPAMAGNNLILKPIAQGVSGIAWLFLGVFFLIGLAAYARSVATRPKGTSPASADASIRREALFAREPLVRAGSPATPGSTTQTGMAGEAKDLYEAWKGRQEENTKPTVWSIDLIRDIEWKRFEDVCQRFYEMKGIRSETTVLGPDGGIDIRLYQDDTGQPTSVVQCKAWGERLVGVKPVRELLGVMTHEKIGKAFFMTSGRFSDDAKEVAKANRITLIGGEMLLMMIQRLPDEAQRSLLDFATAGDYQTPTCPGCGIKMKAVTGKTGRPDFWGCPSYPRCRQRLPSGTRTKCSV